MQPERLMLYFQTIIDTADVPGPVVEVGAHLCGTSILACRMMKNLRIDKPYICVDTFRGFVPDQFKADIPKGTPARNSSLFADNSEGLARRILRMHKSTSIRLVAKDCSDITPDDFPDGISTCLIDVDLSGPVYQALRRIWPLMNAGGRILVDDCSDTSSWRARDGLQIFCSESGIEAKRLYGMGMLQKRVG
jgi:hypothetical protein